MSVTRGPKSDRCHRDAEWILEAVGDAPRGRMLMREAKSGIAISRHSAEFQRIQVHDQPHVVKRERSYIPEDSHAIAIQRASGPRSVGEKKDGTRSTL
jgi:hypothetical protein